MSKMMWTNSETHEFIDLYKSEPILWDPKHPLKRSRPEVTDAWIRIQKAFSIECSVTDLKKKKESLMSGFRINVLKKRTDDNYTPSWFAYDQMASFLGEFYEGNGNEIKHEGDSSLDATYFEDINDTPEPAPVMKSRKRKHKNKESGDSFLVPEFVQFTDTDENEKENHKNDDVCDIFCQLLALKLRKLDEYDREVAMHEIDNIMFKAKIKKCSKPTRNNKAERCESASFTPSDFDEEQHLSDD